MFARKPSIYSGKLKTTHQKFHRVSSKKKKSLNSKKPSSVSVVKAIQIRVKVVKAAPEGKSTNPEQDQTSQGGNRKKKKKTNKKLTKIGLWARQNKNRRMKTQQISGYAKITENL